MKTFLIVSAALLVAAPAFSQSMNAGGRTHGAPPSSGVHWCNWSIAKTCSRWRANGNKSYGLGCTGPNDMRSGCVAERRGLK
jgi:hypothetical protein